MENIPTTTFDFLSYDNLCIAIAVVAIVLLVAQVALYIWLYARVASHRMMSKTPIREEEPAISVVVPLFIEDSHYLDHKLPELLTQDYPNFEVVLVYVGNSDDFFNEIKSLQNLYPNLSPKHIDSSPRYPVSTKLAINVGIIGAKHDFVVISSYDAIPSSERWLSLLAKGFMYGDITLAYSGMERKIGFLNFIIREYQLNKSLAWISSAIRGHAYAGSRHTLGFKKSLYFDVRGFNHLNMNVGEDDLFVQKIATRDNVSVVLSPRATCTEFIWGGFKWWLRRIKLLRSTYRYYPKGALFASRSELVLRALFFLAILAAIIVLPWKFKAIALAVALLRYLIVAFVFMRNAHRLGERRLLSKHILYDFIEPGFRLFIAIASGRNKGRSWN